MTQCDQVANHLIEHGSINDAQAREHYGISRLAARIYDLRGRGFLIESEDVHFTTRLGRAGRYTLYRLKR
mgnify:CR=1 FL=1